MLVAPDFTAMSMTVCSREMSYQKQTHRIAGGISGNCRRAISRILIVGINGEIDAFYGCRWELNIELMNQSVRLAGILICRCFGCGRLAHNADVELCWSGSTDMVA